MARRRSKNSSEPQKADLAPEQIPTFIRKLERRLSELEEFDSNSVDSRDDPRIAALVAAVSGVLSDIFGQGTVEYNRYSDATELDTAPWIMGQPTPTGEVREGFAARRPLHC